VHTKSLSPEVLTGFRVYGEDWHPVSSPGFWFHRRVRAAKNSIPESSPRLAGFHSPGSIPGSGQLPGLGTGKLPKVLGSGTLGSTGSKFLGSRLTFLSKTGIYPSFRGGTGAIPVLPIQPLQGARPLVPLVTLFHFPGGGSSFSKGFPSLGFPGFPGRGFFPKLSRGQSGFFPISFRVFPNSLIPW